MTLRISIRQQRMIVEAAPLVYMTYGAFVCGLTCIILIDYLAARFTRAAYNILERYEEVASWEEDTDSEEDEDETETEEAPLVAETTKENSVEDFLPLSG